MSDEYFRIAIVAAVFLGTIAFVVQSVMIIALYRRLGRMHASVAPVLDTAAPVLEKVGPMVDKFTVLLEKGAPALEKAGAAADQLKSLAGTAGKVLASTNRAIDEVRPKLVEVTGDAADFAKSGRVQVERLGNLLYDASQRAQERLTQIDQSVESTVRQVEEVSGAMRRAVQRPVREVNGLAAGISAAVSTLVKGSQKSSVDAAVQDEEMFI